MVYSAVVVGWLYTGVELEFVYGTLLESQYNPGNFEPDDVRGAGRRSHCLLFCTLNAV